MNEPASPFHWREHAPALLLLLLIFAFHALTIRQGHAWGDDFALYVHEGQNLAEHRPLLDTGYIYNVREAFYGPRFYPPVLPALLAPVISVRGLDFGGLKLVIVIAWIVALAITYWLYRGLKSPYRLLLLAALGFNPLLWEARDSVLSDFPFLAFFLASVLLMEGAPRRGSRAVIWGCCTGLAMYLSYGTRSIGLILLTGLALYEVLRVRALTAFAIAAGGTLACLVAAQRFILGSNESSYAEQFHPSLRTISGNVHDYLAAIAAFWPAAGGRSVSYLLFAVTTALAVYGVFRTFRFRTIRPLEATLLFYIPVIMIWPGNQGIRFMLPVLPAYFGFALAGLQLLVERWGARAERIVPSAVAAAIVVLYLGDYHRRDFSPIREAVGSPRFNDMCRFIGDHTGAQDPIVFYRARLLSLVTGRPASVYFIDHQPSERDRKEEWEYIRKIGSRWVVYSPLFEPDRKLLRPVIDEHAAELRRVYHNSDFVVYERVAQ